MSRHPPRPRRDPRVVQRQTNGRSGTSNLEDLVVISGLSGAGKSSAMNVFEDAGYFCVDNLPAEMIRSLAELFMHEGSKVERAAVVWDSRGGEYLSALAGVIDELDAVGLAHRVVFLDADEQTLLNRYKETRRRHPLAPQGSVVDGHPRRAASCSRRCASARDIVIDTSGLSTSLAAPQGRRRAARARARRRGSPSPSSPSATSTARRATPTSRSTSASCPTRTGSPTCAR